MAVIIEQPNAPRSRKGAQWEKRAWIFMRVSGIILVGMIIGHLMVNLVLPERGVKSIDFAFVAGKWASPFWQVYDGILLWLALIHGTNGMRTLVNDYTEREWLRKALNVTLWVVAGALLLLGTLVITTFDPCIDPNVHNYLPELVCKG
ncbi:MAG: succinate dehydrogenase hydrophobic membrane anchor subunit [Acidobacteria bacterium]|nr:succinate dehydrogenase hydrophobic membrane anchor subunit [Acidobacteriota bacterium]